MSERTLSKMTESSRFYLIFSGVLWFITAFFNFVPCTGKCSSPGLLQFHYLMLFGMGLLTQLVGWPLSFTSPKSIDLIVRVMALTTVAMCIYFWFSNAFLNLILNW